MKDILEQVLRKAEFDEVASHMVRREFQFAKTEMFAKLLARPDLADMMGFLDGARHESKRLLPLIRLLAERLEVTQNALWQSIDVMDFAYMQADKQPKESAEARETLAQTEAALRALL